jgi:hypothetical protein
LIEEQALELPNHEIHPRLRRPLEKLLAGVVIIRHEFMSVLF